MFRCGGEISAPAAQPGEGAGWVDMGVVVTESLTTPDRSWNIELPDLSCLALTSGHVPDEYLYWFQHTVEYETQWRRLGE